MDHFDLLHLNEILPHGHWILIQSEEDGTFLTNIFSETRNNKRMREKEIKIIINAILSDDYFSDPDVYGDACWEIAWMHERFDETKNDGYTYIDINFNSTTMVWFVLQFRGAYVGEI